MARATASPEAHRATVAEIRRQTDAAQRERVGLVAELIAVEKSLAFGGPPMPADEAAARKRALDRLNGLAPANLSIVGGDANRQQSILIEIRALDITLDALSQREVEQAAADAYEKFAATSDDWTSLVRELLLTGERFLALEDRARKYREQLGVYTTPGSLPFANVGVGMSLLGLAGQANVTKLREHLLAAGVVTEAAIRRVRDAQ